MITIPVHTLSRKAIIYKYGSDHLKVESIRPLLPLITTPPFVRNKIELNAEITIDGPDGLIRSDGGYNLYDHHMEWILDYMRISVANGRHAYTAMLECYRILDLDLDDPPTDRTYKRWQRAKNEKNGRNYLYKPLRGVLRNINVKETALAEVLTTSSRLIQSHPEVFMGSNGIPSTHMVQKAIMYAMWHHHRWPQRLIAEAFDMTQANVSVHLSSMSGMVSRLRS